ncbi:MAG: NAD(P)-binding domain-containing protein [Rhodococcus sp.]|nr:NAD(P)-binding domain-containing protein [Rhodococcus sp. (in: high G+C Gram-positive bacteria)]
MTTTPLPSTGAAVPTTSLDTVVIGAGQAGLATGYHLARKGRRFVILDANPSLGDNWRCHWDSLRLYSPAGRDALPGMKFPAEPDSFPGKDQVANYLETYAETFDLPVHTSTRVHRVTLLSKATSSMLLSKATSSVPSDDQYLVDCGAVRFVAHNVVVATGTFGRAPAVPEFAHELDPSILQLHSSEYHNPAQLQDGPVLVVGASHSGCDIAFEVADTHRTILCGRDTGQIPVPLESRRMHALFPVLWFVWGHVMSLRTPIGRKLRRHERLHGAPALRVKRADLTAAGVERVTDRMTGVRGGRALLGDDRIVDATNIVWCTGFHQDYSWIDLPVLGEDGWPLEQRGVVADAPGLYFVGLAFQSSFRSMLIGGAGADAQFVVQHLVTHRPEQVAMLPA